MGSVDLSKYNIPQQKKIKNIQKPSGVFDFLNRDISLFGNQLNDKKKERFYSELHVLLLAGIDIKTSLELVEEDQIKPKDKKLFTEIKNFVVKGGSLSEAIKSSGKFSAYEYYSLQIGEESGRIVQVLGELHGFFSKKIKQNRQIISALSYPIIVLLTAFGAIFFMMRFVVPMFADVFGRFGGDLPYLTKMIIEISNAFSNYSLFSIVFILIIIFLLYSSKEKEWYRKISSSIILKIPFVGELVQKIYLARFCHSMNLLIGSKTPMIQSIQLVKKMVGFYPIENSLTIIEAEILKGSSISESLSKFDIYNKRMLSLIRVAEEVNQLDIMFGKLAQQYSDDVEHQTGLIGSMIEPIMIIFLGLMVAVVLIAMYLPMFQLSTSFGG